MIKLLLSGFRALAQPLLGVQGPDQLKGNALIIHIHRRSYLLAHPTRLLYDAVR
jgi:hypothetical protein